MKDPRFILGTIILLALGAFGLSQWQKNEELNRQISQLRAELAAQAATAKEDAEKLQKQIDDRKAVIAQMEEQRKNAVASEPVASVDGAAKEATPKFDLGGMMKKMFTDPNMKKMMKGMQTMGVKMMYSDLAKELGLTSEQSTLVMDILGERQMALTTKGMKIFGGDADGGSAQEVGKDVQSAKDDYDAQLESVLGKDGMAKLNEYERTTADRMTLQQYKQAFAANGVPLDENESQSLLGIMKEERLKQPPSPLDPGAKDVGAAIQAIQSEEVVSKLMAAEEDADRRVLSRAGKILAPDKMVQLQKIQEDTRNMRKMGIEMGSKMFNAK